MIPKIKHNLKKKEKQEKKTMNENNENELEDLKKLDILLKTCSSKEPPDYAQLSYFIFYMYRKAELKNKKVIKTQIEDLKEIESLSKTWSSEEQITFKELYMVFMNLRGDCIRFFGLYLFQCCNDNIIMFIWFRTHRMSTYVAHAYDWWFDTMTAENGALKCYEHCTSLTIPNQLQWMYHIKVAACNGHVCILKYICEKSKYTSHVDSCDCYNAIKGGHLEMIEYLHSKNGLFVMDDLYVTTACENNQLPILKFLHSNDYPINRYYCTSTSIQNAHFHIMDYLLEHDLFDINAARAAIYSDQPRVLKYLRKHNIDIPENLSPILNYRADSSDDNADF